MKPTDGFSVIILPKGKGDSRRYELSPRRARFLLWAGAISAVVIVAMAASWSSLAVRATRTSDLARQLDSVVAHSNSVDSVARQLAGLQARQERLQLMLGHVGPLESGLWLARPGLPTAQEEQEPLDGAVSEPLAWPLTVEGFLTQSLVEDGVRNHPGIDIAVPTGSYILAAGRGEVLEAAEHPDYGLFVLIDHGNGLTSRYGHASELLVARGWQVRQGEVIAVSGSTGRSTAPHLHFEILNDGRPADPLSLVTPPS